MFFIHLWWVPPLGISAPAGLGSRYARQFLQIHTEQGCLSFGMPEGERQRLFGLLSHPRCFGDTVYIGMPIYIYAYTVLGLI